MATYELITDAAREFDHDYDYATVLDTQHQPSCYDNVAEELVIVVEVDEIDTARYEEAIESDGAVIIWSRIED